MTKNHTNTEVVITKKIITNPVIKNEISQNKESGELKPANNENNILSTMLFANSKENIFKVPKIDLLKQKNKLENFIDKYNKPKKESPKKDTDKDIRFPLLPLLLFGLGIILITLGIFALVYLWQGWFTLIFLGFILLIVSIIGSVDYKRQIAKYNLSTRQWPYNLIIGFSLTITFLIALGLLILIAALVFL